MWLCTKIQSFEITQCFVRYKNREQTSLPVVAVAVAVQIAFVVAPAIVYVGNKVVAGQSALSYLDLGDSFGY